MFVFFSFVGERRQRVCVNVTVSSLNRFSKVLVQVIFCGCHFRNKSFADGFIVSQAYQFRIKLASFCAVFWKFVVKVAVYKGFNISPFS